MEMPLKILIFALGLLVALPAGAETENPVVEQVRSKALLGYAGAQHNLAEMYANGYGVDKDSTVAAGWYRKSAEQGYGEAQFRLGLAYLQGEGVPKDEAEGLAWIILAARPGTSSIVKFRQKLEQRIAPALVAAAQVRSKELLAVIAANKQAKAKGK